MDKMYRPERDGLRAPGSKLQTAQAIKQKLNALNLNSSNPLKLNSRPGPMKPISNKEVNKIYRNQGF